MSGETVLLSRNDVLRTHIYRIAWSVRAGALMWIGGVVMLPILGFLGLIPQH